MKSTSSDPRGEHRGSVFRRWHGPMTAELDRAVANGVPGQVPARLAPTATADLVCGFCSTGCGLRAHLRDGVAVNLTPSPEHPVNLGMACPKGWEALTPLAAPDRALSPLARDAAGRLRACSWAEATELFTRRFRHILHTHGPDSVAFLSTGQIRTEEMALLGAFFKFGMGGLHGDCNTRQCMATAHVAYKQSFGFDAPPYTYADLEESDVLVFVGANPCIAHPDPVAAGHAQSPSPQIIVVDPRRTETAMAATRHLALQPQVDLPFSTGSRTCSSQRGRSTTPIHRRAHERLSGFREFIARRSRRTAFAGETGLTVGEIVRAADTIGRGQAPCRFWWTMGVNQGHEATRTAQAIINLALITGNIGRPGTGANSITGQCNAMGSRLFGNATSLLGGRNFRKRRRSRRGRAGPRAPRSTPSRASLPGPMTRSSTASGGPHSRPLGGRHQSSPIRGSTSGHAREALASLDFLVVQDMYTTTETAPLADLLLPAAGWGEKEGTFINSERRIGVSRKVARAPGTGAERLCDLPALPQPGVAGTCFAAGHRRRRCSRFSRNSRAGSRATSPASATSHIWRSRRWNSMAASGLACPSPPREKS